MKNKTLLTICASALVGLSMGATVAMAYTAAGGGIVGSKHDMNQWVANGDPYQRVCAYCHTPHHAIKSDVLDYNPLWAHTLNESVTFSKYQSASLNASITDPLVGPSRLCMSCHDGVIAIDQHYSIDGGMVKTGDNFGNIAVANGQGDLSNDHPIGFDYAAVAAADRGIRPPTSGFRNNPQGLKINDTLTNGIMTCATCHEVYNKDNVADAKQSYNYFIYAPERNSDICLSCHDK